MHIAYSAVGHAHAKKTPVHVDCFSENICKINCERFEPRSHFISRLSMIARVNVFLKRTVVVGSVLRIDNLCSSYGS